MALSKRGLAPLALLAIIFFALLGVAMTFVYLGGQTGTSTIQATSTGVESLTSTVTINILNGTNYTQFANSSDFWDDLDTPSDISPADIGASAPGDCNLTSAVQNTTATGVECVSLSAGSGTVTSVSAGYGLNSTTITTSGTLNINASVVQNRVNETCAAGTSIRIIAEDGSVTCETDSTTPDTNWAINASELENQSGTLGVNKTWLNESIDARETNESTRMDLEIIHRIGNDSLKLNITDFDTENTSIWNELALKLAITDFTTENTSIWSAINSVDTNDTAAVEVLQSTVTNLTTDECDSGDFVMNVSVNGSLMCATPSGGSGVAYATIFEVMAGNYTNLTATVAACPATGCTVYVPAGYYDGSGAASDWKITNSNLQLIGLGQPIIQLRESEFPFWIVGSVGTQFDLTSNVSENGRTIPVNDSSSFSWGDMIVMLDDENSTSGSGTNISKAESVIINNISGNTLYLEAGVLYDYNTDDNAQAQTMSPVRNVEISGFWFNGSGQNDVRNGVYIKDARDILFHDNKVSNVGIAGVFFFGVYNSHAYNNEISNVNYTTNGYAFTVNGYSKNIFMHDNLIKQVDEILDCSGNGWPAKMFFHDNIVRDVTFGFDQHPNCFYVYITNNDIDGITGTGPSGRGVTASGTYVYVRGNTFKNVQNTVFKSEQEYATGQRVFSTHHYFLNNIVIGESACWEETGTNNQNTTVLIGNTFIHTNASGNNQTCINTGSTAPINTYEQNTIIGYNHSINSSSVGGIQNYGCNSNFDYGSEFSDTVYNNCGINTKIVSDDIMTVCQSYNGQTFNATHVLDSYRSYADMELTSGTTYLSGAGKNGGGVALFDGSNDRLTSVHNTSLNGMNGTNFSYVTWIYMTVDNSTHGLIGQREGTNRFFAYVDTKDTGTFKKRLVMGIYNSTGTLQNLRSEPADYVVNAWYHIAIVYDDSVDELYVYRNGILVNTYTITIGTIDSDYEGDTTLGYVFASQDNYFGGYFDEARYYKRVLSLLEVKALMDNEVECKAARTAW